uniref:Translocator protein homolog n=1 Tax=Fagus sylvatica TaxID=28930 RepID=A0A2N9IBK2_FAGSY
MASQTLQQHCPKNEPVISTTTTMARQDAKRTKAKRALRSLAIAIVVPLYLTMTIIFMFGSGHKYQALDKPFWFPPLWFIHIASLGSSFLMGFASWLVWADGGFHTQSDALPLYIAQISLSIVWDPLVLVMDARRLGLVFCCVNFGTLLACHDCFRRVPFVDGAGMRCVYLEPTQVYIAQRMTHVHGWCTGDPWMMGKRKTKSS